jgi:hypothetical protein
MKKTPNISRIYTKTTGILTNHIYSAALSTSGMVPTPMQLAGTQKLAATYRNNREVYLTKRNFPNASLRRRTHHKRIVASNLENGVWNMTSHNRKPATCMATWQDVPHRERSQQPFNSTVNVDIPMPNIPTLLKINV